MDEKRSWRGESCCCGYLWMKFACSSVLHSCMDDNRAEDGSGEKITCGLAPAPARRSMLHAVPAQQLNQPTDVCRLMYKCTMLCAGMHRAFCWNAPCFLLANAPCYLLKCTVLSAGECTMLSSVVNFTVDAVNRHLTVRRNLRF